MALPSSGTISLNQIHVEAGGTSGTQAGMNDSDIRALIGKNASTTMSFSEWYGASASVTVTISSNATDRNASTLFGSDFSANVAKVLIINSGVEIGTTSFYALNVPAGMGGTLNIQNAGTISGAGGAGSTSSSSAGGNGGTALYIGSSNVTVTNTGTIRGGGGGGGRGSDGNDGYSGEIAGITCDGGSGGSGGSGGNGQGFNQSQSNGSSGTQSTLGSCDYPNGGAQGTNGTCDYLCQFISGGTWGAGRTDGSSGGNGGTYGNAGSQGNNGGTQGGSAGAAIQLAGGQSYTLSNSGTLLGSTP